MMNSDRYYIEDLKDKLLETATDYDMLAEHANLRIAKLKKEVADIKMQIAGKNKVTRLEIIDHQGRNAILTECKIDRMSYQDEGRTLKIFVGEKE